MTDVENKNACSRCVGDDIVAREILSDGGKAKCDYCGKRRTCIDIGSLARRVDDVYREQYAPGAEEAYFEGDGDSPSYRTIGETPDVIIGELLQCEVDLASDLVSILSKREAYDVYRDGATAMYDDGSNYEPRPILDYEFAERWTNFVDAIKHRSRFFMENSIQVLDDLFTGIIDLEHHGDLAPVRIINKRSNERFIFRARRANSEEERIGMCLRPAQLLGPPPKTVAPAGRMNAAGISVMYAAFSAEACVSELRLAVGEFAVSCKFEVVRPLRVLDLTLLHKLYKKISPFDSTYNETQSRLAFFDRFEDAISKPVRPGTELEYLPTQVLAEYLSTRYQPKIDAVIYASAQGAEHANNIVVLPHAAIVKGGQAKRARPRYEEHRREDHYSIWDTKGTKARKDSRSTSFSFFGERLREVCEAPYLEPVKEGLCVHEVVAVDHEMNPLSVELPVVREADLPF